MAPYRSVESCTLQHIRDSARQHSQMTAHATPMLAGQASPCASLIGTPSCYLPEPQSLASTLITLGLEPCTALFISDSFMQMILRLKVTCELKYTHSLQTLLRHSARPPTDDWLHQYHRACISQWRRTIVSWSTRIISSWQTYMRKQGRCVQTSLPRSDALGGQHIQLSLGMLGQPFKSQDADDLKLAVGEVSIDNEGQDSRQNHRSPSNPPCHDSTIPISTIVNMIESLDLGYSESARIPTLSSPHTNARYLSPHISVQSTADTMAQTFKVTPNPVLRTTAFMQYACTASSGSDIVATSDLQTTSNTSHTTSCQTATYPPTHTPTPSLRRRKFAKLPARCQTNVSDTSPELLTQSILPPLVNHRPIPRTPSLSSMSSSDESSSSSSPSTPDSVTVPLPSPRPPKHVAFGGIRDVASGSLKSGLDGLQSSPLLPVTISSPGGQSTTRRFSTRRRKYAPLPTRPSAMSASAT